MERPRGSLFLLVLLLCHAVALLLFCKGFLLRRVVIPEYSNCTRGHFTPSLPDESRQATSAESHSCYPHPRRFKRVVWLLIDALRYDFMEYDPSLDPSPPVHRNKLPFVRDLLAERPQNARLFRFVADPPTTTMQRLKALTTGSLPTFIDIGSNFNSHQITEDSLPYQTKVNGRNLTFIGDDTWLGLYEGMLTRVFDYPSLNVKDLHTVDNGVIEHMGPELKRGDAEFLVGHFLGVDHVGHTYGSTHWTMGEKLTQMNSVLQSVFSSVGEDTIVFVFGDHGMTVSGDHGGETELETTAALLVFTPYPLFPPLQHTGRAIYQIDIVPTVSLLLGVPIPFSNLGMIIPEVFLPWGSSGGPSPHAQGDSNGYGGRVTLEFLDLLQANAKQIQTYLKTYVKHSEDFPSDVYVDLQSKFTTAQRHHSDLRASPGPSQEEMSRVATLYIDYMREVKTMCHNVWAKFDNFHINQGVILFSITVLLTLLALFDLRFSLASLGRIFKVSLVLGVPLSLVSMIAWPLPLESGVTSVVDLALSLSFYPLLLYVVFHSLTLSHNMYMYTLLKERSVFEQILNLLSRLSFTYVFGAVVAISCSVSLASNSYILYEGDMTVFFLQSMLICFLVQRAQSISGEYAPIITPSSSGNNEREKEHLLGKSNFSWKLVLRKVWPLIVAMVLVRLSKAFHDCRDFQIGCQPTLFILPYHGIVETLGGLADARLAISCLGVLSVPLALAVWVRYSGDCVKLGVLRLVCVYVGLPLSSVCVCGFWLIQSLPQPTLDSLPYWQHVSLPRIVYSISLTTIGVSIFAPLRNIGNEWEDSDSMGERVLPSGDGRKRLPNVRQRLTTATSTTSPPDASTSKTFSDISLKKVNDVTWSEVGEASSEKEDSVNVDDVGSKNLDDASLKRVSEVVKSEAVPGTVQLLPLLVALWLPVAMVLNDGVALSAVLLALQIYLVLSGLLHTQERSWPVVVVWGLMSSQFFFGFGHHATVTSVRFDAGFVGLRGEMSGLRLLFAGLLVGINMLGSHLLFSLGLLPLLPLSLSMSSTRKTPTNRLLLTAALQFILFHSFKTLMTLLTASLQRRHLMVWGVFSPRFLYEAAFLGVTHVSLLLSLLSTSSLITPSPSTPPRTQQHSS